MTKSESITTITRAHPSNQPGSSNDLVKYFYTILFVLWIAFERFWTTIFNVNALGGFSHAVVFLGLAYCFISTARNARIKKNMAYFILSVALLTIVSAAGAHSRNLDVSLLAALLYLQIAYVFILIKPIEIESLSKIIILLCALHLLGIISSFIFSGEFSALRNAIHESGRILGFQLNPNALAFMSAILATYFMFIRKNTVLSIILVATILWSGSRSALLFFVIATVYLGAVEGKLRGTLWIVLSLVAFSLGLYVFSDRLYQTFANIEYTLDGAGLYVRAAMMSGGYQLAVDNFPFGAGGGTFGSPLAVGMEAYQAADIDYLPLIYEGKGIHDSGVGSLLGEYGFLGFIITGWLMAYLSYDFGKNVFSKADIATIVILVLLLSFFRGVVSSYYYSLVIVGFALILRNVREGHLQNGHGGYR